MGNRPRLIVVDDDVRHLQALRTLLQDEGYEVDAYGRSLDALAALEARSYDLLLSDIQMAELDGVTLVRGASVIQPDLIAILMTAHATVDNAIEAMKLGVFDFIRKPFRITEIRPVIARALEVRQLRLENLRVLKLAEESNAQLESVNAHLNSFAGRVSHDLQAVMQVIAGFASALQRDLGPTLEGKQAHYLRRVVETSERGTRLVNELLAFARLGERPLEFTAVNIADTLQLARRALAQECENRQVEWVVGDLPLVHGDPDLLQQVLVNLLSNALKFSRDRQPARISIEWRERDPGVEILVRDNGVGFDTQFAQRLFQPFERLHAADQFPGNGMGLAHVRKIVERHGGEVRAESSGEGALFAFTLPIGTRPPAPPPGQAAPAAAQPVAPPGPRILAIDDDPIVLMSLRNMLEIDGAQVDVAAGGQIGVDAFERALNEGAPYDVVVTDFGMPQMDGREVARRIKELRAHTVVILLSGWGSHLDMRSDWQSYVDNLLSKPPRLAELRKAVAQWHPQG
ncbi:MAG: response regulator [Pseudomonadota bacterium]